MELRSMRTGALCLAAATGFVGLGSGQPANAAKVPTGKATVPPLKAPSPTGRLIYKTEIDTGMGMTMAGTMTVIWAEGGKNFRQETKLTGAPPGAPAGSAPTTISSWTLGDGNYMYTSMPMMGKTAYRQKLGKQPGGAIGAPPVGGPAQGKVVGKGTVLDRPCEIREVSSAKLWMWKGLALKMEKTGGQGPKMKMVATKLEMPFKSKPTQFKVPAGYTITDNLPGMPSVGGGPGGGGPGGGGMGGGAPRIRKGSQ